MKLPPGITLRDANGDDEALLRTLFEAAQPGLAQLPLTGDARDQLVQTMLRAQETGYRSSFPGSRHEILCSDGVPVGRVWLHRTPGLLLIVDLSLLPSARGRGLGSAVIQSLLRDAAERGEAVRCSVRPDNPALRLYLRLGFVVDGGDGTLLSMLWTGGEPAPAPEPEEDARPASRFQHLVGSEFALPHAGLAVQLVEAVELPVRSQTGAQPAPAAALTLLFEGPAGRDWLPQGIHRLEHPTLPSLELFLVPVGPAPSGGMQYEAVLC